MKASAKGSKPPPKTVDRKAADRKADHPKAVDQKATTSKSVALTAGAEDLSFLQSRTALELVLAELQTSDLDVEHMATLYRRGLAYIDRCEAILEQVEHEVLQWAPQDETSDPKPLEPT
ncbi:exodeoxyribonuclease VII small subunit [Synechococcus sp. CS-1328]|nr:exodeoxyribonuclease VII small subunit [Synechococcus sp. CS-1328]